MCQVEQIMGWHSLRMVRRVSTDTSEATSRSEPQAIATWRHLHRATKNALFSACLRCTFWSSASWINTATLPTCLLPSRSRILPLLPVSQWVQPPYVCVFRTCTHSQPLAAEKVPEGSGGKSLISLAVHESVRVKQATRPRSLALACV